MPATRLRHLVAIVFAALVVTACGGSDGGDPRNAIYTAYASNGERFTLDIDFDGRRYAARGLTPSTTSTEGTFVPDSASGAGSSTFVFQPPANAGNTARFRVSEDLIVGSFKLGNDIVPFVASRRFASSVQDAAGTYNTFGVDIGAGDVANSTVQAARISSENGLQTCADAAVLAIASCPPAQLRTHALTMDGDTFTAAASSAAAGDGFSFRVARAGSEKIYLVASTGAAAAGRKFRIGLPETSTFGAAQARGASNAGEWNEVAVDAGNYSSNGVAPAGNFVNFSGTLTGLGANAPAGVRVFERNRAYVMQGTQLVVVAGAPGSDAGGYLQINSR